MAVWAMYGYGWRKALLSYSIYAVLYIYMQRSLTLVPAPWTFHEALRTVYRTTDTKQGAPHTHRI